MLDSEIQTQIDELKANPDTLAMRFEAAARAEGRIPDFRAMEPDAGYALAVQEGDTLMGIARRFSPVIEGDNLIDVINKIAAHNNFLPADGNWENIPLAAGQTILIPLPPGVEIHVAVLQPVDAPSPESLVSLFNSFGMIPEPFSNDLDRAAAVVAALNPGAFDDLESGDTRNYLVPAYEDFSQLYTALPPSDPAYARDIPVPLFISEDPSLSGVVELRHGQHQEMAYAFATGFRDALTGGTGDNPIMAFSESTYSSLTSFRERFLTYNESDIVIFSQSYAFGNDASEFATRYNDLFNDTAHFVATGNWHVPGVDNEQYTAVPHSLGPRSYTVGATETSYNGFMLADYSSPGADFLAPPLATYNGSPTAGTSFATPMMAEAAQIMVNRFGGVLTYEEIMAAASMSTEMNISQTIGFDQSGMPQIGDVPFITNGGGRPHNERAGAGMIDVVAWQDNLTLMAQMKSTMQYVPDRIDEYLAVDNPAYVEEIGGRPYYMYEVTIPFDMTLDRLTFDLPREGEGKSEVIIRSPSGFTYTMMPSPHDAAATAAFALEDVRAGDTITIAVPDAPLSAPGIMALRGHSDGNVIQLLRNHLTEEGLMPLPNTVYSGATPLPALTALSASLPAPGEAQAHNAPIPDEEGINPTPQLPDLKF